jgi:putative DNA primase/helicase
VLFRRTISGVLVKCPNMKSFGCLAAQRGRGVIPFLRVSPPSPTQSRTLITRAGKVRAMSAELSTLGEAALELARCGFAVFPCEPRGKKPIVRGGFKRATIDRPEIEAWWRRTPDANIGVATGTVSRIIVIDVDGEGGETLLAALEERHGALPDTAQVRTGRGRHVYFRLPQDDRPVPCSASGSVDIRGDGGYVIGPGSVHPSGAIYEWVHATGDFVLALALGWLIAFAQDRKAFTGEAPSEGVPAGRARRPRTPKTAQAQTLSAALSIKVEPPPETDDEVQRVISALRMIPAVEREVWLRTGMALHWTSWANGRRIWDAWSRTAPDKFDAKSQDTTWASFARPYQGAQVTFGTIFAIAGEHGWAGLASPPTTASEAIPPFTRGALGGTTPLYAPKGDVEFARFPRTDAGNGEAFLALYGEDVRFVEAWGRWLVWNSARWAETSTLAMLPHGVKAAREMHVWAVRRPSDDDRRVWTAHALATERDARLAAMLKLASAHALIKPDELDADPWLLGCPNGTLDLKTGKLREARREDFITKQIGVAFDPAAECPEWLRFLDRVMQGDRESVAFLQRLAGYVLTGVVREEVLPVFIGDGSNGKTTWTATLLDLMGDYGGKAQSDLLVHAQGKEGAPSPDVAALQGKRLVVVSETEDGGRLSEARVKDIVSNERIPACRKYGHPFEFTPTHKLILTTNHPPRVDGTDHGIWRRLAPVKFGATIGEGEKDPKFRETFLVPELPGILNWAVRGCLAWQRGELRLPASVKAAAAEYRSDMDQVAQWIEERTEIDLGAVQPAACLHSDFVDWSGPHGRPLGKKRFGQELDRKGFAKVNLTGGVRGRRGLRLKASGLTQRLRVFQ